MKKKIRVSRAEIGHAATKIAYFRPGLKSGSWIPEERAGSRHGKSLPVSRQQDVFY
jgi:hypothetical protein